MKIGEQYTGTIRDGVLLSIPQSSLSLLLSSSLSLKLNLNVTYLLPANHSMTCMAIKPFDTLRFDKGWQVTNPADNHCLLVTHTETDTEGTHKHALHFLHHFNYHHYSGIHFILLEDKCIVLNRVYLAIRQETLGGDCYLAWSQVCFAWNRRILEDVFFFILRRTDSCTWMSIYRFFVQYETFLVQGSTFSFQIKEISLVRFTLTWQTDKDSKYIYSIHFQKFNISISIARRELRRDPSFYYPFRNIFLVELLSP